MSSCRPLWRRGVVRGCQGGPRAGLAGRHVEAAPFARAIAVDLQRRELPRNEAAASAGRLRLGCGGTAVRSRADVQSAQLERSRTDARGCPWAGLRASACLDVDANHAATQTQRPAAAGLPRTPHAARDTWAGSPSSDTDTRPSGCLRGGGGGRVGTAVEWTSGAVRAVRVRVAPEVPLAALCRTRSAWRGGLT